MYIGRSRNLYLNDSYKIPSSAHRSETLSFQFDLSDKAEN
ncbi:hypothetical protein LEP1GSC121_1590 [Leptospira borgpetersenii serovar Castellonis str. 200801910]|nr:hypothetical protein LEP1GSC121_1590 [Leptospira borgpetersenii serovar Castellonis str. 200801910]